MNLISDGGDYNIGVVTMKILHINCNYILSNLHQCLVERLKNARIDNDVFVATYDKKRSIIKPASYVRIVECFNKWDRIFFDYKQSKILSTIQSEYDISNFDCIHAYTLFTDGNTAMKLSKKYGVPYVVAIRNTDVNDFLKKRFYLRARGIEIMKNAQKVFFLSEAYKTQVFDKYIPKKYQDEISNKTLIIPNGIDDFWIENQPTCVKSIASDSHIKLIYAGRIDKNKNIPTTQRAMDMLKDDGYDVSLKVVGRIDDKKEFEKIIKNKNTEYFDAVPRDELIRFYRESDIFVMPSFTESFGLVYAEAMSQGLPVIYSKRQGFDGQFPEGMVGFSVNSNSVSDVYESIKRVINEYSKIAEKVVEKSHRFNWDEISKLYMSVYSEMETKK